MTLEVGQKGEKESVRRAGHRTCEREADGRLPGVEGPKTGHSMENVFESATQTPEALHAK